MLRSMKRIRTKEEAELEYYRETFILNCRAFGVQGLDTPYPHFKDEEGL